jgi:hypothetical protein
LFASALDGALERHGSVARCNPEIQRRLNELQDDSPRWNGWSGANSEVARRQGAYELARYLKQLQSDDAVRTIHIVAHSHGGNVVWRAMRYLNRPTYKLGKVVALGTPFLHFDDRAAWRRVMTRVHWPMLLVAIAIGAGIWMGRNWFMNQTNQVALYVVGGVLVAVLLAMWRYARSSEASSLDVPTIALQFDHDEAIRLLRACAAFVAEPHILLRELLGGPVPPWPHVMRKRSNMRATGLYDRLAEIYGTVARGVRNLFAWMANFWNHPVCAGAERLTGWAYRTPLIGTLVGSVCALLLIMAFRPYRPAVLPFLTSRLPRMRALFFVSLDEMMTSEQQQREKFAVSKLGHDAEDKAKSLGDKLTVGLQNTPLHPDQWQKFAALAPVLVYWLVFLPVDKLLGILPWFGAVATRFSILIGTRAAASGAAGIDMLATAFEPRRTAEVPVGVEKVTIPAAIEEGLEQRLDAATRVNLAPLRRALDPAKNAMLLDAVRTAFTDPALLHAQYYQDPRIVDYIAQRIAETPAPSWQQMDTAA